MDLFGDEQGEPHNLLPYDGVVQYHGVLLSGDEANHYLQRLLQSIDWQHDEAIIDGKRIVTARQVAWHADKPFEYTYSKTTKIAQPWTPELIALKTRVEQHCGERFNACLLNLYHDGSQGMSWHSDAERQLKRHGAIASFSLGAERKFAFKHKSSKHSTSLMLQHGSLLVMKGCTQTHWLHRLPPTTKIHSPRVNLTFRMMVEQ